MTVGPLGTAGGMYRYIIGIFTRRTFLALKRHFQNFSSVASSSSGGAVPFSVSRSISTSMYLPGGGASPADCAARESRGQDRNQQRISQRRCNLTRIRRK